ncbi:MAG: CopD family protein [Actinomycetota bacterium]
MAAGLAVLVSVVSLLATSAPVRAHTDLESTAPADGDVLTEPVETIVLTFNGEATPTGEGFVALDVTGVVRAPVEVDVTDGRVFTLRFDPPLAGGPVGIRWTVRSGDSHVIDGAFSFTVDAPVPTTAPTTTLSTTSVPVTPAASTEPPADSEPTDTSGSVGVPPPTAAPSDTSTAAVPSAGADDDSSVPPPAEATSAGEGATALDDFLAEADGEVSGDGLATAGRAIGFLGVAFALGVLAFLATTLRGRATEVRATMRAVRLLALAIATGAAIEYVGVARMLDEALTDAWFTSAGFAATLRFTGGIAVALGLGGVVAGRSARSLSAATAAVDLDLEGDRDEPDANGTARWRPDTRTWTAGAGVLAVVASFWFDGHTVTEGARPGHAVVNSVHVVAGAVWVGGVAAIAALVWSRRRAGRPGGTIEILLRFSRTAALSLAAVVVAGGAMAVMILDSINDLTGTDWGRTLLVKSGAVVLAALAGAYNHVRLLPALEARPDSPDVLRRLRNVLTAEAILLGLVVVVTAWLVAAAI